ncbi:helix-turn-helix domain-containing protein [Ekhidna sp.]
MYTQIGLTEKIAIVEGMTHMTGNIENQQLLVPNNMAEIYIPFKNVEFKCIGSVRSITLKEGDGYFFMPRRRGASISLCNNASCLIVRINPLYANKIAYGLNEISNGISLVNFSISQKKSLIQAWENEDTYMASDVLEEILHQTIDLFEYNDTILNSIEQIQESFGRTSIKEIYSNLNVSKSKLEQHFNREVGLTPKEFCKIEKINYFINSYLEDPGQSLTELTYLCGYYDQSHLIKDFKYFLDTSPKKFFAQMK